MSYWYQFLTRCEELVPIFHGVKFAKWEISVRQSSVQTTSTGAVGVGSGPKFIKLFSCSAQMNTKIIMLINVIMPTIVTIVGIFTCISMINTTMNSLKAREVNILTFQHFSFYEQLKFCAQLSWAWNKPRGLVWYGFHEPTWPNSVGKYGNNPNQHNRFLFDSCLLFHAQVCHVCFVSFYANSTCATVYLHKTDAVYKMRPIQILIRWRFYIPNQAIIV